jgi:hypothetical protein
VLNPLKWDPIASANYQGLKRRLSPFRKEQLDERIDVLREWPPAKWFELRDREDGTITFQMETDQFAMILGRFEDGTVYITHFELRSKVRE